LLPHRRDLLSLRDNPGFAGRMAAIGRDMRERGAVVAFVTRAKGTLEWRPTLEELPDLLDAEVLVSCADGVLYRASGETPGAEEAQ